MFKKTLLAAAPLFFAAWLLTACAPQPTQAAAAPLPAQSSALIAEGRLLPVNTADQAFAVPGQVAEVLVQDGEQVAEGQALARLASSPEGEAALARAEQERLAARQALDALDANAALNLAQAELNRLAAQEAYADAADRYAANDSEENLARQEEADAVLALAEAKLRDLKTGSGVNPDERRAAEARLAAAEAALISAQAALDRLELKATASGTVVDLDLRSGQWVAAGAPVLTLADFSSWVVKTDNLTESEVVGISVGQPVEIVLDALPNSPLAGTVAHINARYEEKRGDITYTVTVVLEQADPLMRWGMTAAAAFQR